MDPANTRRSFFCSQRLRMGSLPVLVLLLFVQVLLGLQFSCANVDVVRARVYGSLYLILPAVFLFILGLLLRTRRSPGLFGTKCCSCRYCLYVVGPAGRAPLIWILLSMIDSRYLVCLVFRSWDYYFIANVRVYVQIAGIVGLVILLILDYAVPQSTWAQEWCSYCFQKWNEDLDLQEVEIVLQQKAEENRKAFLEDIIRSDLDQLKPEELCHSGAVSDLVWKYKDIVQNKFAERGNLKLNELQKLTEA